MLNSSKQLLLTRKFIEHNFHYCCNYRKLYYFISSASYRKVLNVKQHYYQQISFISSESTLAGDTENCKSIYHEMEKDLKFRQNPVITTLDTPEFQSIFSPNLNFLHQLFQKYNYEIRIAGGAVRLVFFSCFLSIVSHI